MAVVVHATFDTDQTDQTTIDVSCGLSPAQPDVGDEDRPRRYAEDDVLLVSPVVNITAVSAAGQVLEVRDLPPGQEIVFFLQIIHYFCATRTSCGG